MNEYIELINNSLLKSERYNGIKQYPMNPILFVFIGEKESNKKLLDTAQSAFEYHFGTNTQASYLCFSPSVTSAEKSETVLWVGSIQKDIKNFLDASQISHKRVQYDKPLDRRICIVLDVCEIMPCPVPELTKFIQRYFENNGYTPYIDLYLVVDDDKLFDDEVKSHVKKTMEIFKDQQWMKIFNMTTFLSTLNNFTVTMDMTELYEAIVLSAVVKVLSFSDTGGYTYSERAFKENALHTSPGRFYTLGIKRIFRPVQLIQAIALREVFGFKQYYASKEAFKRETYLNQFKCTKIEYFDEIGDAITVFLNRYKENMYSLCFHQNRQAEQLLSNGDELDAIFGVYNKTQNNVDAYYDLNRKLFTETLIENLKAKVLSELKESIDHCLSDEACGFYHTCDLLGDLKEHLQSLILPYIARLENESRTKLNQWRIQKMESSGKFGKKIAKGVYESTFALLSSYLDQKIIVHKNEILRKLCEVLVSFLDRVKAEMLEMYHVLESNDLHLKTFITEHLKRLPSVLSENFEKYYSELASAYLRSHAASRGRILEKFYLYEETDLKALIESGVQFVSKMLQSNEMNENVFSEINHRILGKEFRFDAKSETVTNLLDKEIFEKSVFFSCLLNSSQLYKCTLLITTNHDLIEHFVGGKNQNLCLIRDNSADGLTVLYFAGLFDLKDLLGADKLIESETEV